MKTLRILIFLSFLVIGQDLVAQNGVYQSIKFEFISKNEPARNRVEYKTNKLIFQINEFNGEFTGGKILWEMKNEGQSEFLEISLLRMKNTYFDKKIMPL